MKSHIWRLAFVLLASSLVAGVALARGGGGGFRGGGGGGFRGGGFGGGGFGGGGYRGGGFDGGGYRGGGGDFGGHVPSMSRDFGGNRGDFNRGDFNRGDLNRGDFDRPSADQLGSFLNLPREQGGPQTIENRFATQGGLGRFGDATAAGNRADGQRRGSNDRLQQAVNNRRDGTGNRADRANQGPRAEQRQQWGNDVRNRVDGQHHDWFNNNWWHNHPNGNWGRWAYWRGHPAGYWWRGAGWGALAGWMAGSWATPYYYDYGGNITYANDNVYVDGQPVASADEYADQATQLADTPPPADNADVDWMPLGTFALSTTKEDKDPVMMLQLAVSKEGQLTGTYYNTATDNAQPIKGGVDRTTQRVAFTIGNKDTVLETGIYNLTKNETPVLVHFATGETQTWLLVRLNEPKETQTAANN